MPVPVCALVLTLVSEQVIVLQALHRRSFEISLITLALALPIAAFAQSSKKRITSDNRIELTDLADSAAVRKAMTTDEVPASFEAVVTYWNPERGKLFVQNGEGTFVRTEWLEDAEHLNLDFGQRIKIDGTINRGGSVTAESIERLRKESRRGPPPTRIELRKLGRGSLWSRFVQLDGRLRRIFSCDGGTQLVIQDGHRSIVCFVDTTDTTTTFEQLLGRRVQARGVLGWKTFGNGAPRMPVLEVASADLISALETFQPPPAVRSIDAISLLAGTAVGERISLAGTVTFVKDHESFLVEDESGSLNVKHEGSEALSVGDKVVIEGTLHRVNADTYLELEFGTHGDQEKSVPGVPELTAFEIVETDINYQRVTTQGRIDSVISRGHEREVMLSARGIAFRLVFSADDSDFAALRLEDGLHLTARGLVVTESRNENVWFTIYADCCDCLWIEHETLRIARRSIWQIALALGLAGVVGVAWLTTLRLNVRNKTRHLNGITARLNAAYEAIQEGIVILDRHQRVVSANSQFSEITGITNPIGMQQATLRSELARRFDLSADDTFWSQLTDGSELKTERRVGGVKNPQQSVIAYLAPVHDERQHLGVLLALRDITEHAELEVSLRQAQKMEAVGRLAGGIAHDFNNLLMVMSAHNEGLMARIGHAGHETAESLQATEDAIQRATELVRNLMGFSRRTPLTLETHCLNDCVKTVVALLRRTVPSTIRIDAKLQTNLPGCRIDRTQVEQVLMNICLNSRDAIPKDSGCISISTVTETIDGRESVVLRVQDDGEGMSREVKERVFEPFFTTKEVGKGTGLGMSTSYGIIEQHDGHIEVASTPQSGTCVTITLPASKNESATNTATQPALSKQHGDYSDLNVLVVDDEQSVRNVSMKMLERLGCKVSLADSGLEALRMVNEHSYDLVLLDLNMPEMSGGDVCRRLASQHPELPVIVCTGYLDNALFDGTTDEPAAVLRKPFRLHDLELAMNEALSEFCRSAV